MKNLQFNFSILNFIMLLFKFFFIIIFLLIILIIIYRIYKKINNHGILEIGIENFEDLIEQNDSYQEIYDSEFVNFYEIIYRDYTDIDYDLKMIAPKIFNEDLLPFNMCVAGSGVGKLCNKFKSLNIDVVGVDISETMLKKSQSLYPNIKFIRGNLTNRKILNADRFSHIFIDERTLYYNNEIDITKIIYNCFFWIKENGFLIVPIYDPEKLQCACRYYSSNYIDDKGNVHGFTYLNDFSHDCYYIKDEETPDKFNYFDKIILDNGKKRVKKTSFYIPSKEKIFDIILNNGFEIVEILPLRIQVVGGYDLAIFKKKNNKINVKDLI